MRVLMSAFNADGKEESITCKMRNKTHGEAFTGVLQSRDSNDEFIGIIRAGEGCGICKYGIFVLPLRAFFGFGLRKSPKAAYEMFDN